MRLILIFLMALVLVTGCEKRKDRVAFDGQFFKAKAKKVGENLADIQITVSPVSASLGGAREAGRYEATKYCIENFGLSDMTWTAGPDADAAALTIENDTLYLRGTCDG